MILSRKFDIGFAITTTVSIRNFVCSYSPRSLQRVFFDAIFTWLPYYLLVIGCSHVFTNLPVVCFCCFVCIVQRFLSGTTNQLTLWSDGQQLREIFCVECATHHFKYKQRELVLTLPSCVIFYIYVRRQTARLRRDRLTISTLNSPYQYPNQLERCNPVIQSMYIYIYIVNVMNYELAVQPQLMSCEL